MKKKRGRKKNSGVLTGIKPDEEWSDIRGRIIYGSAEWRIVRLRQLVLAQKKEQATAHRNMLLAEQKACRDEKLRSKYNEALRQTNDLLVALERGDEKVWKLTDNFFSARAADIQAKAASAPKVTLQDLDRLWNKLRAKRKGKPPARDEWLAARDELYKAKTGKPYEPKPPDEIAWLWRELAGQFQRAVLNGDSDWLTRQAKAIQKGGLPQRARFNAKVLHLLEIGMWGTQARTADQQRPQANPELDKLIEQRKAEQAGLTKEQVMERKRKPHGLAKGQAGQDRKQRALAALMKKQTAHGKEQYDLALTPAGKFTDAMASDIYNVLEKESESPLVVEGYQFESKERVMEAIHDLAKRFKFALCKQH